MGTILENPWVWILAAMILFMKYLSTPAGKGMLGEWIVSLSQKAFLPKDAYVSVNDIYLKRPDGETTQIDHCVVSRFGLFVVETKNMAGTIYGKESDREWTQAFPGGRKFKFQNPLRQNYAHIRAISEFLGIPESKMHSVVYFAGDAKPSKKTPMPENVLFGGYVGYVKGKTEIVFSEQEVEEMAEALRKGKIPSTRETRRNHVRDLKERHGK